MEEPPPPRPFHDVPPPFTLRWPKCQQNNHGMDHQDVHSGCFSTDPAKVYLILGLGLSENEEENGMSKEPAEKSGWRDREERGILTQLYTSSPSLLWRTRLM